MYARLKLPSQNLYNYLLILVMFLQDIQNIYRILTLVKIVQSLRDYLIFAQCTPVPPLKVQ